MKKPMFDFNEKYLRNEDTRLSKIRRFKEVMPPERKELIVESKVTGYKTVFKYDDKKLEYFDNKGNSLTSSLEMYAALGNSKVSIYAGKGI